MDKVSEIRRRGAKEVPTSNAEPNPSEVLPFGRYGGGLLTGHPIGLVIVVALLLMGFIGIPEIRWFFLGSFVLGGLLGFVLWLVHR
jgi:predicted lipid-binding transport protein (Tim44 family)